MKRPIALDLLIAPLVPVSSGSGPRSTVTSPFAASARGLDVVGCNRRLPTWPRSLAESRHVFDARQMGVTARRHTDAGDERAPLRIHKTRVSQPQQAVCGSGS